MIELREYQQRTIDQLYQWFRDGGEGNPCLVLPTGAGKSHVVAALCKDSLQSWPETRILMLTHVKELIEQNAEKMRELSLRMVLKIADLRKSMPTNWTAVAGVTCMRH
jgi:superfamily II DNA or RNA helicase